MDRTLALEFVRVTEAAALKSGRLCGRGAKDAADQLAVDGMRQTFDTVPISGTVVIGEGEIDEAPMLYIGERVGAGGEEVYGQHPFEGDLALLVVEALRAPEVGDPGLGRHPRAPEEHDVVRLGDPLRQRGRVVTHDGPLRTRCRLRQR